MPRPSFITGYLVPLLILHISLIVILSSALLQQHGAVNALSESESELLSISFRSGYTIDTSSSSSLRDDDNIMNSLFHASDLLTTSGISSSDEFLKKIDSASVPQQGQQAKQLVIQFKRALSAPERRLIGSSLDISIKTSNYVHRFAYIVYTRDYDALLRSLASNTRVHSLVQYIGKMDPRYKSHLVKSGKLIHTDTLLQSTNAVKHALSNQVISARDTLSARLLLSVAPSVTHTRTIPQDTSTHTTASDNASGTSVKERWTELLLVHTVDTVLDIDSILQEWNTVLQQAFIVHNVCSLRALRAGSDRVKIMLYSDDDNGHTVDKCPVIALRDQVVQYLASQETVIYMEHTLAMKPTNGGANAVLQSGQTSEGLWSPERDNILWKNGFKGDGEIVHLGDTGIDHDHCFFHDPNVELPVNKVDNSHRKIVAYYTTSKQDADGNVQNSDTYDGVNDGVTGASGHGTHCAGTIAGAMQNTHANANTELKYYHGVAPSAKLAFTDFENEQHLNYGLIIPPLYETYLPQAYATGARISSNSWGSKNPLSCSYDCKCKLSTGEEVPNELCISVYDSDCCRLVHRYDTQSHDVDKFLAEHDDMIVLFAAGNDGKSARESNVASPATSKNCVTVGAAHSTLDVFMASNNYTDNDTGAKQVGLSLATCCTSGLETCTAALVYYYCCSNKMGDIYQADSSYYSAQSMADFSSRGPLKFNGMIKPDIAAPGAEMISAHSDGNPKSLNCGLDRPFGANDAALVKMRGTSMATPAASGATALVRQYYRTKKNLDKPSGMLLKATLALAARPMTGKVKLDGCNTEDNIPQTYPNKYSGHGLVQLDSVLELDEVYPGHPRNYLIPLDREKLITKDDEYTVLFRNNGSSIAKVRAAMTWYDPVASITASAKLVNVLHLSMSTSSDNKVEESDKLNNIKRLEINVAAHDTVRIKVSSSLLDIGPQSFALVISSNQELVQGNYVCFEIDSTDAKVCSGHGKCIGTNVCQCDKDWKSDKPDCAAPNPDPVSPASALFDAGKVTTVFAATVATVAIATLL